MRGGGGVWGWGEGELIPARRLAWEKGTLSPCVRGRTRVMRRSTSLKITVCQSFSKGAKGTSLKITVCCRPVVFKRGKGNKFENHSYL